jgi:hypothetical protein
MILQLNNREQIQAANGCERLGILWRFSRETGARAECHVGTVEWCQQALGYAPRPDYYPLWLAAWWRRGIKREDVDQAYGFPVFAKPSAGYKQEAPRIIPASNVVPAGWWHSEVVRFVQEWRYYVADGELLGAGWYDGSEPDEPAPPLIGLEWPRGFCGAVDFGRLDDGRIALVESHHPFACGNYMENDECEAWAMWLEIGWRSL